MARPKRKKDTRSHKERPRSARGRVLWVCRALEKNYGRPSGRAKDPPLDVLINAILSQNTNDSNRDKAYFRLKDRFRAWEPLAAARPRDIERAIEPAGLYRQKSRAIKRLLQHLIKRDGRLDGRFLCRMKSEEALRELTALKGIGVKTVSVALMFGCGRDDVFPVDTHVLRVSKRLELIPGSTGAARAHELLGRLVPDGKGASLHLNMVRLGREICRARRPLCGECYLAPVCPWPAKNRALVGRLK